MPLPHAPRAPFVLLDDALASPQSPRSRLYTEWVCTDLLLPEDIDQLDERLRQGWRKGWQVVLLGSYEFGESIVGIALTQDLQPKDKAMHLLWFAQCAHMGGEDVETWLAQQDISDAPSGLMNLQADVSKTVFFETLERIHAYIEQGETYQVNYTHRLHGQCFGDPLRLYRALRTAQPVPFGVLACLKGDEWILSLSPELFVRHDGTGLLTAQPMKGTAAQTESGAAIDLSNDIKNRAENLMIVDLLRNDLGKIAQTGSVQVQEMFAVRPFGCVLQMTSTVHAQALPNMTYADLFRAIFPCGSITGAPKRRTMQIIQTLESSPRGLYTGMIGWIDPAPALHAPGAFCFSVAIRTVVMGALQADKLRHSQMGVGAGIVYDSQAPEEHEECALKTQFLCRHDPGFSLIETMRIENQNIAHLNEHLQRLAHSADIFGFALAPNALLQKIQAAVQSVPLTQLAQLRLLLNKAGEVFIKVKPLPHTPPVKIGFALERLPTRDPLRKHKTTHRALYDQACQKAQAQGVFDLLFFNEREELLEGARSTVFVKIEGCWLTPALSLDILPGIMRQHVINNPFSFLQGQPVKESIITRHMLKHAQQWALANALRGVMPATLATPLSNPFK